MIIKKEFVNYSKEIQNNIEKMLKGKITKKEIEEIKNLMGVQNIHPFDLAVVYEFLDTLINTDVKIKKIEKEFLCKFDSNFKCLQFICIEILDTIKFDMPVEFTHDFFEEKILEIIQ